VPPRRPARPNLKLPHAIRAAHLHGNPNRTWTWPMHTKSVCKANKALGKRRHCCGPDSNCLASSTHRSIDFSQAKQSVATAQVSRLSSTRLRPALDVSEQNPADLYLHRCSSRGSGSISRAAARTGAQSQFNSKKPKSLFENHNQDVVVYINSVFVTDNTRK
jgi:hypothetical protein